MESHIQTPDFDPRPDKICYCGSGEVFSQCCGKAAPDRPPPFGVILVSDWFDPAKCDELTSRLEQQPRGWLTTVDKTTGEQRLDPMRVTEKVALGEMESSVVGLVKKALIEVAEPDMDCRIESFVFPNVLRYSKGGTFRGHADSEVLDRQTGLWKKIINRDISMLIYLNDGFQGGNITFTRLNYSYHPRKGDLLIFPSDHRYAHRAEPVTSGVRYSIVSWAAKSGTQRVLTPAKDKTVSLR